MNLIVDVGNTSIKIALFNKNGLQQKYVVESNGFLELIENISTNLTVSGCIVSAVGYFSEENFDLLTSKFRVVKLSSNLKFPFINKYKTKRTLGVDRIALVSAAAVQYPNQNVLVIDAGTCITYDFLSNTNEYLGGAISPGLSMRFKALHTFTDKLPLLTMKAPPTYIGSTTEESMRNGVLLGILNEIDGVVETYKKDFSPLQVILTGGDTLFLRDRLKSDIFANSNFLLEGLHYILEHNKD